MISLTETFIAGETRIILMLEDPVVARGRLDFLSKLAHWMCRARDWSLVRSMYEAVLESIELGEEEWTSDFSHYETMIVPGRNLQAKSQDRGRVTRSEVYWCKAYQRGSCTERSPHMAQVRMDEAPVPVMHICAHCWQKDNRRLIREVQGRVETMGAVQVDFKVGFRVQEAEVPVQKVRWEHMSCIPRYLGQLHTGVDVRQGLSMQQQVQLVNYVRSFGKPNIYAACIPLRTAWNVELMKQIATSVSDREVVQFIQFGWPLNHDGGPTTCSFFNHKSAVRHHEQVTNYIVKEVGLGCLLGPFISLPWSTQVAVSPLSTRAKKEAGKRRIIMDLSWPLHGKCSVNDGIDKNVYLGQPVNLVYPSVDLLRRRIAQIGAGQALGYKRDLDRAFKQIFMCVASWLYLGMSWDGLLYFDKTAMMGSCSAPYICQRVTSFVRHVMHDLHYFVANYVDDFMGIEQRNKAMSAYITLGNLLRDMGVQEAEAKAIPPTEVIEFLGVWYDMVNMTISMTSERLNEVEQLLLKWDRYTIFSRNQLESLLGKLQFISNCVRLGRVMVLRLRNSLRKCKQFGNRIPAQMRKDLKWWGKFLRTYNGVSIMWLQ